MLSANTTLLKDKNLPSRLGVDDLVTSVDMKCLQEVLRDSNIGLVVADITKEVGNEIDSAIHVYVTNSNDPTYAKATFVFHTTSAGLNELNILDEIRSTYRLFPDSIYSDSTFTRLLETEKELSKAGVSHTESNVVVMKNILTRLGFSYDIVVD